MYSTQGVKLCPATCSVCGGDSHMCSTQCVTHLCTAHVSVCGGGSSGGKVC